LGLLHVQELLEQEVTALAGARDARQGVLVILDGGTGLQHGLRRPS
jgi:hypothetical protein